MAACCGNVITPKMIRTGQMQIGDQIQLDWPTGDAAVFSHAPAAESQKEEENVAVAAEIPAGETNDAANSATVPAAAQAGYINNQNMQPTQQDLQIARQQQAQMQQSWPQQQAMQNQQPMQAMQNQQQPMQSGQNPQQFLQRNPIPTPTRIPAQTAQESINKAGFFAPLDYTEMTSYMNGVNTAEVEGQMSVAIPQTPLTTQAYTAMLDPTDLQQYIGFLQTQIGRYMRIEQLIGSNTIEQRFGFLVGVGSNFIILQEITTGNIMLIDLFSIKLTYIYYSDIFLPQL